SCARVVLGNVLTCPTRRASDHHLVARAAPGERTAATARPRRAAPHPVAVDDARRGRRGDDALARRRERVRREILEEPLAAPRQRDRKSTRLNSSHVKISYAVFV